MSSPIEQAIRQICDEKGLSYEAVLDAIQAAMAAAYRKDYGDKNQNVEAEFDPETGAVRVYDVKTVVEDVDLAELERMEEERRLKAEALAAQVEEARAKGEPLPGVSMGEEEGPRFNPKTDIMLSEAKVLKHGAQLGDVLHNELPQPGEFGRMAAMTAKQVITQKLREAEREIIFNEFKQYEGQILNGTVQRRDGRVVLVDLGRATGIIRPDDQIASERYVPGARVKVYVKQVALATRGPEILLSRSTDAIVRSLFETEIPEVAERLVDLKAVAREAGARSKVAVAANDPQIDPIGACIGQRGTRIQTVIAELGGEKVDIIEWDEDPAGFIAKALSPAKVDRVELNEETKTATVHVPEDQLSLAIGRGGQNVRLASKLSGWKINIAEVGRKKESAGSEKTGTPASADGIVAEEEKESAETLPVETPAKTSDSVGEAPSAVAPAAEPSAPEAAGDDAASQAL